MKYRKVIIDGKEYLEIIDEEKVNINDDTLEVEIEEGEEPKGGEKFWQDTQEFFGKIGEGAKNFGVKIGEGARTFGEKVARDFRDAGQKIKEGTERLFAKDKTLDPSSKEAQLIKLLPYMSAKEKHEVAEKILEADDVLLGVDLSCVLPFLSAVDCTEIFKKCIELGREDLDISMIMQYVDPTVLSEIVDGYIEGKYEKLDIDLMYPFLSDGDISRIFYHIVKKQ